ncbi:MAG: amino acid deaminase [Acuticoccus sp.]
MTTKASPTHLAPPRLDALLDAPIDPSAKGLPVNAGPVTLATIGARDWHVFGEELPLPLAVLKADVIASNSAFMSRFAAMNGLLIAPHGKTTMAPQLYDRQIRDGAWAITVATAQQLGVCLRFGVGRIILANQPVGQAVATLFEALSSAARPEIHCLADSRDGVALLAEGARRRPPPADNPLRVLVELGVNEGRTGARTLDDALEVARAVAGTPGLMLAGFECFEGILPDTAAVDAFLDMVVEAARAADGEGLLGADAPVVLSAGGSAFFDRVGERFAAAAFEREVLKVLRSGCYLTHDSIGYARAFERIMRETTLATPPGGLEPALEVWAHVQSRPEPGVALLTLGKRDISHDAGLPVPLARVPRGEAGPPRPIGEGYRVTALNDQHCYLALPPDSALAVGDRVGFGIGHPCTTFDKWALLMVVDADYRVIGGVRTFF